MSVPESITRDDLLAALEPLGNLLGVDLAETYLPLVIGAESVVLTVTPPEGVKTNGRRPYVIGDAVGVVTHTYSVRVD